MTGRTDAASKRLDELVRTHNLSAGAQAKLGRLARVLSENASAPTAVRDPIAVLDVHLADSLCALTLPELEPPPRPVADLGSGAGLPGLVLAIAWPHAGVALVESVGRKAEFLRRTAEQLELPNVEVVAARAEEWWEGRGTRGLVTARALASAPAVLEYAAPLLAPEGLLVDWRGRRDAAAEADSTAAARILGLERLAVRRIAPFDGARDHHLHLYVKVRDTPQRYPRRVGTARKRPLGRSSSA